MNKDLNQLSADLRECLDSDKPDFQKILNLANKIAAYDPENVRFTIDASHITKLGLELVAKQETAISELVKNAYDADAANIKLVFKNTDQAGGTLEIIDDGSGMTRSELANGFMRISTSDKIDYPKSKKYSRQRAGRKGIGRFSAQRLGRLLTIKTQVAGCDYALQVSINWDIFEESEDLILVNNQIKLIEKLPSVGTILIIDKLRDSWSDAQIKRAYRYVSDLLQPFPLSKSEQSDSKDPGFKATFYKIINGGTPQLIANDEKSILSNALATFSGYVDHQGKPYRSCISSRFQLNVENEKLIDKDNSHTTYQHLRDVEFKAYYFITDELPSGGVKTFIRGLLREQGGIRVYRNGFRVLPYGEPYDDWLGLQKSSALREILPPHHNSNFFGFVEIRDPKNIFFNETSSREGLIDNEAFKELQGFLYTALTKSVLDIAEARGKKQFASDPPQNQKNEKKPSAQAKQLIDLFNNAIDQTRQAREDSYSSSDSDNNSRSDEKEFKNNFFEKVLELDYKAQHLLEENGMLRVLAALGLTIGEFTHEIRHTLSGAFADFENLYNSINLDAKQLDIVKRFEGNLVNLQAYANYFDNAVIDNSHRELKAIELRDVINAFEHIIAYALKRQNILLSKDVIGYDLYTKPMHESEWNSILLNLFTNALKAIRRAKVDGKILIRAGVADERLYIEFMDNGDGIVEENRERIFEAFYTTSSPSNPLAPDSEQLVGTGLGLKIVKDIISAAEGTIYLVDPPDGYSTCFRIEIPKADDKDIPQDDY